MPIEEGWKLAESKGMDLVEISPNVEPPVCKLLDFGKYKFEVRKKSQDSRKKQRVIKVKEIKLRPGIDEHDYQVKIRSVLKFLEHGDKVKFSMRFRGREITHLDIAMKLMERVKEDCKSHCKIELDARMDGKQVVMVLAPL